MVPVVDLTRRHRRFGPDFAHAVERVLASGAVLLGDETAALEAELAAVLHGSDAEVDVVAVASGASALQLVLSGLGVGPGDEVIVPAFTAVPTASAVCATGAVPVFVDVVAESAAIDPAAAAAAMTSRTKAVVVVHLYGHPAPVEPLVALGVPVVEDAAQAHGALTGVAGTAAIYSFYPTKNVGGIGDGGAVVTADARLAADVRRRRTHGAEQQYVHVEISQNHRMSELEAAWLRLQLPALGPGNDRRRVIAARYRAAAPRLRWPSGHVDHVFHQCVFRSSDRDVVRGALAERGVATGVHYPLALPDQPAYRRFTTDPCPQAVTWAAECISLPCFPELTDDEVDHVASALEVLPG
ncbi:MAG: DegT/DnrJ/EryC1/StrS family aminotransferase [Ilumatobacteraceae bacterium]